MVVVCLDLEGVLLPEIWINVALKTGIEELKYTTRDISDYDELMNMRINILRKNNIKYNDIVKVIDTLSPLEGARDFLEKIRNKFQLVILSDTFYEFAMPLMKALNHPTLFCHNLIINEQDYIDGYKIRIKDSKKNAIINLRRMNFNTIAVGDSYNDTSMLKEADKGILFNPPESVIKEFPMFSVTTNYNSLFNEIETDIHYIEKNTK